MLADPSYCDLVQHIGVASLGADENVCLCVVQVMYPCWQTPPTVTWYNTLGWPHWVLMRMSVCVWCRSCTHAGRPLLL